MCQEKKVDSIEGFIQETKKDYTKWGLGPGKSPFFPWFRGEPGKPLGGQPLIPRLYRILSGDTKLREKLSRNNYYENRLLQHFRTRAEAYGNTPHRDQTDRWLFLAQHVRLPTRLLDWTESSLAALYFALQEKDPVVWMMDPFQLNNRACGRNDEGKSAEAEREYNIYGLTWVTSVPVINVASANINAAWQDDKGGIDMPVAIAPTYIHARIPAQRSCFTVHGNKKESFYTILNGADFLKKYVINEGKSTREAMLDELRILGVSHAALFPDLDGLAKDLTGLFRPDLPEENSPTDKL